MSQSGPTKKSLPMILGGAVLVLVAGYFGINLGSNGGGNSTEESTPTTVAAPGTSEEAQPSAGASSTATKGKKSGSGYAECSLSTLPDQARVVADTIMQGGPYDHPDNDNKRFDNYEGILPKEKSGYYREYTVETPGLNHRGERRIVTGGGTEKDPDVWYYTDDHYESFCEIPDAEK